jgi:hypothetical protein
MRLNACKLVASSVALGLGMTITTPILPAEDTATGSLENSGVKSQGFHRINIPCDRVSIESVVEKRFAVSGKGENYSGGQSIPYQ